MKTIDYRQLNVRPGCLKGSYGTIRKTYLNNKTYAYKTFSDTSYLKGKIRKLNEMSKIEEENLLTPKFWVNDINNKDNNGYLTEFCVGDNIASIKQNKIASLKSAKNAILKMHSYNLIHGDLHPGNIMYNNNKAFIIDFDNASFNESKINIKQTHDYSREYILKYGTDKSLDVYIFNLVTFSLVNSYNFNFARFKVKQGNYGIFNSKEAKELCDLFFLEKPYSDKDFLIDMIDETSITY